MAIKKTLQCDKCLYCKETSEAKIKFANAPVWMISVGAVFLALGGAGLGLAFFFINKFGSEFKTAILASFVLDIIFASIGFVFTVLYIVKKIVASRLYKCPKCGHRMVPVYHNHRTN